MAIDASGLLGSRQLAGVKVNPPGYGRRVASSQIGGAQAASFVYGDQPTPGQAETPAFGRLAYLAVTDQELALVRLRARMGVMLQPAEVIAQIPRSQLQTAELSPGYAALLTVTFTDGGTWRMEIPPPSKRFARAVVRALGGRLLTKSELPSQPAPRMSGYRILCGIVWAVFTVIVGVGGVLELTISNIGGAIVCFVFAVPAAWYDYRIWTLKARRLLLLI
jgi:hypothetical protein